MKNYAMPLAIAVVGLGLMSIGFNLNGSQAIATPMPQGQISDSGHRARVANHQVNAGQNLCALSIFEPVIRELPFEFCGSPTYPNLFQTGLFGHNQYVVDLTNAGAPAAIQIMGDWLDDFGGGTISQSLQIQTIHGNFAHDSPLTRTAGAVD